MKGGGGMAAVEALELYKRYRGIPAIDGLDLTVEQEEVYAVCGDPGAGKSTLLSILAGLLYPDAGSVEILGVDPCRKPAQAHAFVGYVPQVPVFYPRMTAEKILRYSARLHHVPGEEIDQLTRELMECLELPENTRAGKLSASEQKRLAVGSALIYSPQVLLVDELAENLSSAELLSVLALLNGERSRGITIVFTTGEPEKLASFCSRMCWLRQGRLYAEIEAKKLVNPRFKLLYLDREPIEAVYGIPDLFFVESDGASSVFLYHGEEARLRGQLGALRQEAYRIHSVTREELFYLLSRLGDRL